MQFPPGGNLAVVRQPRQQSGCAAGPQSSRWCMGLMASRWGSIAPSRSLHIPNGSPHHFLTIAATLQAMPSNSQLPSVTLLSPSLRLLLCCTLTISSSNGLNGPACCSMAETAVHTFKLQVLERLMVGGVKAWERTCWRGAGDGSGRWMRRMAV